jgi:hypothetical protein
VRPIGARAGVSATLAAVALAVLAPPACGGGTGAEDVLAETAARLPEIESGVVFMRLRIAPKGQDAERFEVELRGPFALEGPGGLPVARMVYTEVRGRERETTTMLAAGRGVYAEVRGRAYELPGEQAARLGRVREILARSRGLGELRLDEWIEEADLSDGGVVDGAKTERVDGTLDIAAAAADLVELERMFVSGNVARPVEIDAQVIEAATRSTAVRLFTGEHDRLLRRLEVEIDLGFDVPASLRRTLGGLEGARIDFELTMSNLNRPVSVAEPRSVRPASELRTG